MKFRTDLAVEMREYHKNKTLDGVLSGTEETNGVKVTTIEIINEDGERLIGKPQGKYITIETDRLYKSSESFSFFPTPALSGSGTLGVISARNVGHPC